MSEAVNSFFKSYLNYPKAYLSYLKTLDLTELFLSNIGFFIGFFVFFTLILFYSQLDKIGHSRHVKYNIYVLKQEFNKLLQIAVDHIVKSDEFNIHQYKKKIKFLKKANKQINRCLYLFNDNKECKELLLDILRRKKIIIMNRILLLESSLNNKNESCLKRLLYRKELKKLKQLVPSSYVWDELTYPSQTLKFRVNEFLENTI